MSLQYSVVQLLRQSNSTGKNAMSISRQSLEHDLFQNQAF